MKKLVVGALTVGHLRKLLANKQLPDEAIIRPDWADGPPGDSEPGVELTGFALARRVKTGRPYLSIKVKLFYLDDAESKEEGS